MIRLLSVVVLTSLVLSQAVFANCPDSSDVELCHVLLVGEALLEMDVKSISLVDVVRDQMSHELFKENKDVVEKYLEELCPEFDIKVLDLGCVGLVKGKPIVRGQEYAVFKDGELDINATQKRMSDALMHSNVAVVYDRIIPGELVCTEAMGCQISYESEGLFASRNMGSDIKKNAGASTGAYWDTGVNLLDLNLIMVHSNIAPPVDQDEKVSVGVYATGFYLKSDNRGQDD